MAKFEAPAASAPPPPAYTPFSEMVIAPAEHHVSLCLPAAESPDCVFWLCTASHASTGQPRRLERTLHLRAGQCVSLVAMPTPGRTFECTVRVCAFRVKRGSRTVLPIGNAAVRLQGVGHVEGIMPAARPPPGGRSRVTVCTIVQRYTASGPTPGVPTLCVESPASGPHGTTSAADCTLEARDGAARITEQYQTALVAALASPRVGKPFSRVPSAVDPAELDTFAAKLLRFRDWRQTGFGLSTGQPLDGAFAAPPDFVARWLLQATLLFLQTNPIDFARLRTLALTRPSETATQSIYTCLLTIMCGPYDPEEEDSRDSTLLFAGLRQDCDGAAMLGAALHAYLHRETGAVGEAVDASEHATTVTQLAKHVLAWLPGATTSAAKLALCYADPDVAYGNVPATEALPECSLHQVLLLQRRDSRRFFVSETTGLYVLAERPDEADVFVSQTNPFENDLGYRVAKPFMPKRYRSMLMLRCLDPESPETMTVCAPASDGLPFGWSLQDTLAMDAMAGVRLPLQRIPWLPPFVPDLGSQGFRQCVAAIQALAMPEVAAAPKLVPTAIRPTTQTTMLPAYSVAKIQHAAPVFQVGPWWWTVLEIRDGKPCGPTPTTARGASHPPRRVAVFQLVL